MTGQDKLVTRKQIVEDVFAFKKPAYVPVVSNLYGWQFFDNGGDLRDLFDYEKVLAATCAAQERYDFDCWALSDISPQRLWRVMGGDHIFITEDGSSQTVLDRSIMSPDEYPEFTADPLLFRWSKITKRSCKENMTLRDIRNMGLEGAAYFELLEKVNTRLTEYGSLSFAPGFFSIPIESFTSSFRGIKGISIDARKHKKEMKELFDVLFELDSMPSLNMASEMELGNCVGHYFTSLMSHGFLNRKQYEELVWPYVKKAIDIAAANGKRVILYCENSIERLVDLFQEFPKGSLMLLVEQDDPVELRKKLPNAVLAGGIPVTLLGRGTKEECIDRAKELIDGVGEGLMICADKGMVYRDDGKRENMLALSEFLHSGNY